MMTKHCNENPGSKSAYHQYGDWLKAGGSGKGGDEKTRPLKNGSGSMDNENARKS